MSNPQIIYSKTDEAPALATYSLFPIIESFAKAANVSIDTRDISLATRILANFSKFLPKEQQVDDALSELGQWAKNPEANIIKLPNISASLSQLMEAIKELQLQGFSIPSYPEDPNNDEENEIKLLYSKVLGSAVNPVLREGNSDRRVAEAVKNYAKKHPHSMGGWSSESKTHVSHMMDKDFYSSEKSVVMKDESLVRIQFVDEHNRASIKKDYFPLKKGEIIDASVMNYQALEVFFQEQMKDAKDKNVLFSLHLKSTMMKVSDPIIFGLAVKTYYRDVFDKYSVEFKEIGVDPNAGVAVLHDKIAQLPVDKQLAIKADLQAVYNIQPELAMVDSERGITNLHVPSDVIIDASMPAAIRSSGKMWGVDGQLHDMKAVIPDRCYAGIYQKVIDFCKLYGAFDVKTMGSVSNIGLMAQKSEEYGSHDKTFQMSKTGTMQVVDSHNQVLLEHEVKKDDIWRMCQTKNIPIKNWIKLAVERTKKTKSTAIFWLDASREHDSNLISIVKEQLEEYDLSGCEILIEDPMKAIQTTMEKIKKGDNVISITGNVLRDYLTDLFPILELGTSAKMLSIVPLLAGGGLYETGAGGSAPRHVQQFIKENHLRWDSLGEFLAIAASLEDVATKTANKKAKVLADTLNLAISQYLEYDRSPLSRCGDLDNRGSHFYLALYWAKALANQKENIDLQERFVSLSKKLVASEEDILKELNSIQGQPVNIGGYYYPNVDLLEAIMRPSKIFNNILQSL